MISRKYFDILIDNRDYIDTKKVIEINNIRITMWKKFMVSIDCKVCNFVLAYGKFPDSTRATIFGPCEHNPPETIQKYLRMGIFCTKLNND